MKKNLIPLLFLLPLFSCQPGTENTSGKEKLKNLLAGYYESLTKKDTAKMKELTATGFIWYDEGVIYNNESAAKFMEEMPPFTAAFKFDSLNAYIGETNASVYYLREANLTIGDSTYAPMKFLESATFNKENGEWKIRFIHSSLRK